MPLLVVLTCPQTALATEGAQAEAPAGEVTLPPDITLPELQEAPIIPYPDDADASGIEGVVSLMLTLDAEGAVTEANLVQPLHPALDEATLAAVVGFRFSPARRNGDPTPARIRYDHTWRLPVAVVPDETPPPPPAPPPPPPQPPLPPATTPAPKPAAEAQTQDVTVRGKTTAQRMRESAEAVTIVETETAQRENADLGEVLARTQGVSISDLEVWDQVRDFR